MCETVGANDIPTGQRLCEAKPVSEPLQRTSGTVSDSDGISGFKQLDIVEVDPAEGCLCMVLVNDHSAPSGKQQRQNEECGETRPAEKQEPAPEHIQGPVVLNENPETETCARDQKKQRNHIVPPVCGNDDRITALPKKLDQLGPGYALATCHGLNPNISIPQAHELHRVAGPGGRGVRRADDKAVGCREPREHGTVLLAEGRCDQRVAVAGERRA
jgi:hypothetical protein